MDKIDQVDKVITDLKKSIGMAKAPAVAKPPAWCRAAHAPSKA